MILTDNLNSELEKVADSIFNDWIKYCKTNQKDKQSPISYKEYKSIYMRTIKFGKIK